MVPSEKVEALKEYFEGQFPGASVRADWDSDLLAWAFRFVSGPGSPASLRISLQVTEDAPVSRVIADLEGSHWKEALETAGSWRVVFTSKGSQLLEP
jgi:hypothetical protein